MLHQFKGLAVVLALVAAAAAFFMRDSVFFLMSYEGTVVHVFSETVPNADQGSLESHPMAELETAEVRKTVEIPDAMANRIKLGQHIKKRRFSNRLMVQ
jgi:hypothetical protein